MLFLLKLPAIHFKENNVFVWYGHKSSQEWSSASGGSCYRVAFTFSYLFVIYLVWICGRAWKIWEYVKRSFRALSGVSKIAVRIIMTGTMRGSYCKSYNCPISRHCSSHPTSILGGSYSSRASYAWGCANEISCLDITFLEQLVCIATGRRHNQSG